MHTTDQWLAAHKRLQMRAGIESGLVFAVGVCYAFLATYFLRPGPNSFFDSWRIRFGDLTAVAMCMASFLPTAFLWVFATYYYFGFGYRAGPDLRCPHCDQFSAQTSVVRVTGNCTFCGKRILADFPAPESLPQTGVLEDFANVVIEPGQQELRRAINVIAWGNAAIPIAVAKPFIEATKNNPAVLIFALVISSSWFFALPIFFIKSVRHRKRWNSDKRLLCASCSESLFEHWQLAIASHNCSRCGFSAFSNSTSASNSPRTLQDPGLSSVDDFASLMRVRERRLIRIGTWGMIMFLPTLILAATVIPEQAAGYVMGFLFCLVIGACIVLAILAKRNHLLNCPKCKKNLYEKWHFTTATRHCPYCLKRALTEPTQSNPKTPTAGKPI